jgi:ParB-like chromosome segregation protein Spo0J
MIVKKVPVKEIQPNTYNPNKMGVEQYESLKHGIRTYGMIQPILIKPDLTIIDGFHRWKASKEVGLNEIWCVIIESGEEEAKLRTISFNALRGSNDDTILADLLEELTLYFSVDEITLETGFEYSEIKDIFAMSDKDLTLFDELEREALQAKEELAQEVEEQEEAEDESTDKMSVASVLGVGVISKPIGEKILKKFEEIRNYEVGSNVEILTRAIQARKDSIINVEKHLEGLR